VNSEWSLTTQARFPLAVLWKPVTRQLGSLTRAVNSGSGNRVSLGHII